MTDPIVVVDYDPRWPQAFTTVRHSLVAALAGVPVIASGFFGVYSYLHYPEIMTGNLDGCLLYTSDAADE